MAKKENSEITSLVLAKKLYLHGCGHASAKDPVSRMLAIQNFDNAAEIVLKCLATKSGVATSSRQDPGFKDLWRELEKRQVVLPLKDQMFALRDARNIVQHRGDIPSQETVLRHQAYIEDFFKSVCKDFLRIPYSELFLSRLITDETLRRPLLEAERAFEKAEYSQCIVLCDEVLISAIFDKADIIRTAGVLTSYWGASEEFKEVISRDYAERYKDKDFYEAIKDLSRAILQIGQASTTMGHVLNFL